MGIRCRFCRPVTLDLQKGNNKRFFNSQYFFPAKDQKVIDGLRRFADDHLLGANGPQCPAIPEQKREALRNSVFTRRLCKAEFNSNFVRQMFLSLLQDGNRGIAESQQYFVQQDLFHSMPRHTNPTTIPDTHLIQQSRYNHALQGSKRVHSSKAKRRNVVRSEEYDSSGSNGTDDEAKLAQWRKQADGLEAFPELENVAVIDHSSLPEATSWGFITQGFSVEGNTSIENLEHLQEAAKKFSSIRDMLVPGSIAFFFCETFSSFALSGIPALKLFLSGSSQFPRLVLQQLALVRIAHEVDCDSEDDDATNDATFDPDKDIGISCLYCGHNSVVAVRPLAAMGRFMHTMAYGHLYHCTAIPPHNSHALRRVLCAQTHPRFQEDRMQLLSCGDIISRGLRKRPPAMTTIFQRPLEDVGRFEDLFYRVTKVENFIPRPNLGATGEKNSIMGKCVVEETWPDSIIEDRYQSQMAIDSQCFSEHLRCKEEWDRLSEALSKKKKQDQQTGKVIFGLESMP